MPRFTRQLALKGRRARRLVALVLYALAVAGVPLPVPVVKDISQPFPCAGRACGCVDAATCARACCCQSRADRVAWHRERGLRVPAALTEHAAVADTVARGAARPTRSCCAKRHAPAEPRAASLVGLSAVEAAKCRGQVAAGPSAAPAIVPPAAPLVAARHEAPQWTMPRDERLVRRTERPDAPPPRG